MGIQDRQYMHERHGPRRIPAFSAAGLTRKKMTQRRRKIQRTITLAAAVIGSILTGLVYTIPQL